jgi:hypothetical protein
MPHPAPPLAGSLAATSLTLILAGCAGQIAPGGGPVDTTPPSIVRTVPDSAATHVTEGVVELEFSEYVDRLSVQQSVFISPYAGALTYDWSGSSVRITFGDTLRKNTTYVVNVGTDVKDLNAGNKMARGFSLAFSTGDSLDHGVIRGRIFDDRPDGVMLFAYKLTDRNPDTLNPTHTKPDYIQQTGVGGRFELSHLAMGRYRVVAVRDEYRNLLYDRQVDEYGVWRSDVSLSRAHPMADDVTYLLTKEDTTRPFLTAATLFGRRRILLHASEALDTTHFGLARFSVVDTLTNRTVPVGTTYIDVDHPMDIGLLMAAPLDSGRAYRVSGAAVRDLEGNEIDSSRGSVEFLATGEPDTSRLVVRTAFADSARNIRGDEPLVIAFSKHPDPTPLLHAVRLLDSSTVPVPSLLRWRGGLSVEVVPAHELLQAAWYRLDIVMDSVRDEGERPYADSTMTVWFRTFDFRSTGTLDGVVLADSSVKAPLFLTARSVDSAPAEKTSVHIARPGAFSIDRLSEGKWTVTGFEDVDGTSRYHYGLPFPFGPSAPFGVSPDTVKVRARWGVKGVRLTVQ